MPPGLPEFVMRSYYYQCVVICCKCICLRRGVRVGPKRSVRKINWTVQKSRLMEPSSGLGTELVILIRGISLWLTRLIVILSPTTMATGISWVMQSTCMLVSFVSPQLRWSKDIFFGDESGERQPTLGRKQLSSLDKSAISNQQCRWTDAGT